MIKTSIRVITIVFIIGAASTAISRQSNGVEQAPPNIEILSHKWSKIAILQIPDRRDSVFDPSRSSPQTRDARAARSTRYAYELRVKNTGDKAIRAIRWDYVFTDTKTDEEIDRRRFYSPVTIHPNKAKKLEGITRSAPTSTVSISGLPSERVVIECVILSDGSTWRQASFKGSCSGDRK